MIYFLVNNNYHMIDVYEHCENLKDYDKSLIQIPHTLDIVEKNEYFVNLLTYDTPFKNLKNFFNILKLKRTEKLIDQTLDINQNDILLVYTEYELLNQHIISFFKKVGAKIYLIEDGGFATYLTYGVRSDGALPFKEQIKLFYLKHIAGFKFTEFLYYNKMIFPQIHEEYLDGVFLYLDVKIVRNIQKYSIKRDVKELDLEKGTAIFLNEAMYSHYCSKEEHRNILSDVLLKMSKRFETVYFKFHPRETEEDRKWQLEVISNFQSVFIVLENGPIENLLGKYNAKYVFSFFSAALLNVNAMGAIPVYTYHLYEEIAKNSVFMQVDLILKNARYNFIDKDYNITNIGFENISTNEKFYTLRHHIEEILNGH